MSSLSAMKVVVHYMIPPPLILTILLVVPTPRVVNKSLLAFAKNVLFCPCLGGMKLVHFMLLITGMMLTRNAFHMQALRQGIKAGLTPNQHMAQMAQIWREERNFWISVLTFLLWGLLYRFYALMMEHNKLKGKVQCLEAELKARGPTPGRHPVEGVPAQKHLAPSAPPAPDCDVDAPHHGKVKAT